jgi:hypothetical protein
MKMSKTLMARNVSAAINELAVMIKSEFTAI